MPPCDRQPGWRPLASERSVVPQRHPKDLETPAAVRAILLCEEPRPALSQDSGVSAQADRYQPSGSKTKVPGSFSGSGSGGSSRMVSFIGCRVLFYVCLPEA